MASIEPEQMLMLASFLLSAVFAIWPLEISVRLPYFNWRSLSIDFYSAPLLAIAILWALQCLGFEQIRDGIVGKDSTRPYSVLITLISLAYISQTLDLDGVFKRTVFSMMRNHEHSHKIYFMFYLILTILSLIFGNDPVILSATMLVVDFTATEHLEPMPWLISAFAATNTASMVLFTGSPTNLVICNVFSINNAVFSAYTSLPFMACSTFCILFMMQRDARYIPSQQLRTIWTDPLEGLQASKSTIVGYVFLGSCLSAALFFSFLHVDAWKIFLFFAFLKFITDICWDHYQLRGADLTSFRYSLVPLGSLDSIADPESQPTPSEDGDNPESTDFQMAFNTAWQSITSRFPTFLNAFPRLPFALIPLTFSQFILVEGLVKNGWIEVFGRWLAIASGGKMTAVIWLVGVMGVLLCNIAGTNIGATILLVKVIRQANLDGPSERGAAIALAVASNIGAINLTFSSSRSGMLWKSILQRKKIEVGHWEFAKWNLVPLLVMTCVGLTVVCAEMALLGRSK